MRARSSGQGWCGGEAAARGACMSLSSWFRLLLVCTLAGSGSCRLVEDLVEVLAPGPLQLFADVCEVNWADVRALSLK